MYLCYVKLCANLFRALLDRIHTLRVTCDLHLRNKVLISLSNSSNPVLPRVELKPHHTPCHPSETNPHSLPGHRCWTSHWKAPWPFCSVIMKPFIQFFFTSFSLKKKSKQNCCSFQVYSQHSFRYLLSLSARDRQFLITFTGVYNYPSSCILWKLWASSESFWSWNLWPWDVVQPNHSLKFLQWLYLTSINPAFNTSQSPNTA